MEKFDSGLHKKVSTIFDGVKPPKSSRSNPVGQSYMASDIKGDSLFAKIKGKLLKPKPGVNPARQMFMLLLIPILAVAFVLILARNLSGVVFAKSQSIVTPALAKQKASQQVHHKTEINWQKPALYADQFKDPMKGTFSKVKKQNSNEVVVKGIVYSQDNPSAIIGQEIYYQGDQIRDITIVKITKNSVEFEKDGKKWSQPIE